MLEAYSMSFVCRVPLDETDRAINVVPVKERMTKVKFRINGNDSCPDNDTCPVP
jgi:hypothetical protein